MFGEQEEEKEVWSLGKIRMVTGAGMVVLLILLGYGFWAFEKYQAQEATPAEAKQAPVTYQPTVENFTAIVLQVEDLQAEMKDLRAKVAKQGKEISLLQVPAPAKTKAQVKTKAPKRVKAKRR
jgi:cell division protein FtsB